METKKRDYSEVAFIRNEEKRQFEMTVDGHLARIHYIFSRNRMFLNHTEVDPELKGKGVGGELVRRTLEYIKEHDMKFAPRCPYVASYVKRHPEYMDNLAPRYGLD